MSYESEADAGQFLAGIMGILIGLMPFIGSILFIAVLYNWCTDRTWTKEEFWGREKEKGWGEGAIVFGGLALLNIVWTCYFISITPNT